MARTTLATSAGAPIADDQNLLRGFAPLSPGYGPMRFFRNDSGDPVAYYEPNSLNGLVQDAR